MPGMDKTMSEFKSGTLKSGSGQKVANRDQAIAIGVNSGRKAKKTGRGASRKSRRGIRS